jgi:hypothetical protein
MAAPSLLDRHRAEEASSTCTAQRLLTTALVASAGLLMLLSVSSAPSPATARFSSADLARSAMKHSRARLDASPSRRLESSPPRAPHPPPPAPAPAAGVSDQTCHARLHTDYMGEQAPVWGLGKPGFHLKSAAECCAACQAHAAVCGKPGAGSKNWWPARPELRCGSAPACNVPLPARTLGSRVSLQGPCAPITTQRRARVC